MAATLNLPIWRLQGSLVLVPFKNRKRMAWATFVPNLVLLEESEPNTIYVVLTAPTIPCHGVCCIVFDIDGMLFEFFMNFLNGDFMFFLENNSFSFHVLCYFQHYKKY